MNKLSILLPLLFIIYFLNNSISFCQTFHKNVLIEIPGDNYDFDLLGNEIYSGENSYITWINKDDSIYTLYLKKISPEFGENIVIVSDTIFKSNPKLAANRNGKGIKIVWQKYLNNYYQVMLCNYFNDTLSSKTTILDSLSEDPQISLSIHRLVWIDNNNLYLKELLPEVGEKVIIDSSNCSSPDIFKLDAIQSTEILYEKIEENKNQICLTEYSSYWTPQWEYTILADSNSKNPSFGVEYGLSFEIFENEIYKVKYSIDFGYMLGSTKNTICNFLNSHVFSYPVPLSSNIEKTPFFVAFESDSIENNSEIFIETFYYGMYDSLINISNMEGNDHQPKITYITNNDTIYVAIIWLHQNNYKTDIWIAKQVFNPINSSVDDNISNIHSFNLLQNYPNPFNPITKIKFIIPSIESGLSSSQRHVLLKVYDILGNEIDILVNEGKQSGDYEVEFDASKYNLTSGVYFYQLRSGSFTSTKKLILVK